MTVQFVSFPVEAVMVGGSDIAEIRDFVKFHRLVLDFEPGVDTYSVTVYNTSTNMVLVKAGFREWILRDPISNALVSLPHDTFMKKFRSAPSKEQLTMEKAIL